MWTSVLRLLCCIDLKYRAVISFSKICETIGLIPNTFHSKEEVEEKSQQIAVRNLLDRRGNKTSNLRTHLNKKFVFLRIRRGALYLYLKWFVFWKIGRGALYLYLNKNKVCVCEKSAQL